MKNERYSRRLLTEAKEVLLVGKLRIGIIGTGFGTLVQAPAFMLHPECEVVALSGVARAGRARAEADALGIPRAYDNFTTMLAEEELDLVSVVSAPNLHHPMTMAALERRIPVLCEKPMAMDLAKAQAMVDGAERRNLFNAVNFEFRHQPGRTRLKELVAEGFLGDLVHVSLTWTRAGLEQNLARPMGWLWSTHTGGGMLGALGSHMVDTLRWCFGDIRAVSGVLTAHVDVRSGQPADADDTFAFLAKLSGKATGVVQFLSHCQHGFGVRLEAYGTRGTLVLLDDRTLLAGRAGESLAEVPLPARFELPGVVYPGNLDPRTIPMIIMVHNLVCGLRGGPPSPSPEFGTFADGAAVQAVLDAVRQSHREGRWVDVPPA